MRIGQRKHLSTILLQIILVICTCPYAFAQEVDPDTISTRPFDRFWTKPRFVPKVGVGLQDRAFFEIGIMYHHIFKHPLTLAAKGPYASVDVFIDKSNLLLGPKLGYELDAGIVGVALDFTYFIDQNYDGEGSNRNSFVATPKAGISILGFANLFYGYMIPISDMQIPSISRNRFSLVFNLNKDYFNLKEATKRP